MIGTPGIFVLDGEQVDPVSFVEDYLNDLKCHVGHEQYRLTPWSQ